MTWFKVDDKLHDHRKARAAGATAMGVWCLAGSWAADNLTDGFIPASVLGRWGRPREAHRLVEVGLWHADEQDGEKGWRFHEWTERQPSRAQKLEERAIRAEAGRIGGRKSGESRRQAKQEANGKQVASPRLEPPTRPDPTTTSGGAQAPTPVPESAQNLIGEWVERCGDKRPPGQVIGQTAKHVKQMLDEGIPPSDVRAGLAAWHRKGLHPATLASVVHEVRAMAPPDPARPETFPPVEESWMRRRR